MYIQYIYNIYIFYDSKERSAMEFKAVRKIATTGPGRTYYLTLPREMVRQLKWRKGEKKIISQEGKRIIIEDWKE